MLDAAFRLFFVALCAALATGCSWMPGKKNRRLAAAEKALVEARRAPTPVGRVALVDTRQRFALIESTMAQPPVAGMILRTYEGSAVSAELRATGVRRRPFLVADLVSGTPARGELVVQPGAGEETPRAIATKQPDAPGGGAQSGPFWKRWLGFFRGRN